MNSTPSQSSGVPYHLIADNVLDVIWLADLVVRDETSAEVKFTYFTPSVRRVLGYSPAEAIQMSLDQFLTPEAATTARQLLMRLLQEEQETGVLSPDQTLELDHVRKDGTLVTCEITSVFLRDATLRPIGALGVSRDITQRKQAEEALRGEQRLLKQLLEFQERDRQILAYEIHDGLVQQMTGALMRFEAAVEAQPLDPPRAAADFEAAFHLLREGVHDARRLISGLRPPILDEYGIVAAIEYLANETRRAGIHVEFTPPQSFPRLARALQNAVFRIIQESLSNVRKHSECDEVRIELKPVADRVRIEIEDKGVGFDQSQVPPDRFGLRGIRERSRLLDGVAKIESSPGQGTRIDVDLPLLRAEEDEQ